MFLDKFKIQGHLEGDVSIINEQGNLIKEKNLQSQGTGAKGKGPEPYIKKPSLTHHGPKRIRIEYGPGVMQDPIYKFKDNTVRTTKYFHTPNVIT